MRTPDEPSEEVEEVEVQHPASLAWSLVVNAQGVIAALLALGGIAYLLGYVSARFYFFAFGFSWVTELQSSTQLLEWSFVPLLHALVVGFLAITFALEGWPNVRFWPKAIGLTGGILLYSAIRYFLVGHTGPVESWSMAQTLLLLTAGAGGAAALGAHARKERSPLWGTVAALVLIGALFAAPAYSAVMSAEFDRDVATTRLPEVLVERLPEPLHLLSATGSGFVVVHLGSSRAWIVQADDMTFLARD